LLDFAAVFVEGTDLGVSNPGILNNFITVNKNGLYHFEGVDRIFVTGDNDGLLMTPRSTMKIKLFKPKGSLVEGNLLIWDFVFQKSVL
jgi:hypothetical protein